MRQDRIVALAAAARPEPTRTSCGEPGCRARTAHDKPFCIDHLGSLPHVRSLAAELAGREREEVAASRGRWRAIDPDGSRSREILRELGTRGARTVGALGRDLQIPALSVERYLRALEQGGLAKVTLLGGTRGKVRRVAMIAPSPRRTAG